MVDLDIIEPIEKPTYWVNGLVIVEEPNGKLRICLDPRPLNNATKREEIFSLMSGACFFSELATSSGYWQIKVDEESSHLLAFGNLLGHSASENFQGEIPVVLTPKMI